MRHLGIRFTFFVTLILLLLVCGICNASPKKDEKSVSSNVFVLATWNIGHFSYGNKMNSIISAIDYQEKLSQYRSVVYDSIKPDILCLQEYSRAFGCDRFGKKRRVSAVFLDSFNTKKEGIQRGYRCNAIYSNAKIKNIRTNSFKSNKQAKSLAPSATNAYYMSADVFIGKEKITLICLHLAFSKKTSKVAQNQIEELISKYNTHTRVILCGDWNTSNYKQLKKAGYILANNGSLKTFPSRSNALDNIAVKGLVITDVRMIKSDLSDHYPLVCNISIK